MKAARGVYALLVTMGLPILAQASESAAGPITNWWHWGNKVSPPFAFALINFALFLVVMHFTVGKRLRAHFRAQHEQIASAVDHASSRMAQATATLADVQEKMRLLPQLRLDLEAEMQAQMKNQGEQMSRETQRQLERLRAESQRVIELERMKWQSSIRHELAQRIVGQVEATLKAQMQPADQERLAAQASLSVSGAVPESRGASS